MVVVPAYPVTALDTVGAGDAFNGALAVALAEGRSLIEAAVWASDAAALAVTRTGAQDGLPSRDVIDDLAAALSCPAPIVRGRLVRRLNRRGTAPMGY